MSIRITLEKLCFVINDNTYEDISLSFGTEKTGLVGKNGIGKTSLVRMIMGQLEPRTGRISADARIAYLPQDYQFDLSQTVAAALGIDGKSI